MGKNAATLVDSKFSIETHYKELIKVFDCVLENKDI